MFGIGIDFGTANSCIVVWKNDSYSVIPNDFGNNTTPSSISWNSSSLLFGQFAKLNISNNTISSVRKLLELCEEGNKLIPLKINGEEKSFHPVQLVALFLQHLKEHAEKEVGETIKNITISIPVFFSNANRLSIVHAATLARLDCKLIISTAAIATSLVLENLKGPERNTIIIDFGAGKFGASYCILEEGIVEMKSHISNSKLGGEEFDNQLVEFCKNQFFLKNGIDISSNRNSLQRLKLACEVAKIKLSTELNTKIEIENLDSNLDFSIEISRKLFEEICADLLARIPESLNRLLLDSKIEKKSITEIALFGGCGKIPIVQEIISKFFGKEINLVFDNPHVAIGASIYDVFRNRTSGRLSEIVVIDCSYYSLGFEIAGGKMNPIINRGAYFPAQKSQNFTTYSDNGCAVIIRVYEGESVLVEKNKLVGRYELCGISPAPRGVPQIEVTFKKDHHGIFEIRAEERNYPRAKITIISEEIGSISREKLEEMKRELEDVLLACSINNNRAEALYSLENFAFGVLHNMEFVGIQLEKQNEVKEKINEILNWLQTHQYSETHEFEMKKEELFKFIFGREMNSDL